MRKNKRAPSAKQFNAMKNLVVNGGNVAKAMRDAGYSAQTAKSPAKLTKSEGFRALCDELKFDNRFVISALKDDVMNKPGHRIGELTLASRILGLVQPPQVKTTVNVLNTTISEDRKKEILDIL